MTTASTTRIPKPTDSTISVENSDQSSKHWYLIAIALAGIVASTLGISGSIGLSYMFHSIQLPPSWFTTTIDFIGNTPHFWSLWVIAIGGCALGLLAGFCFYKVYRDKPKGKIHSIEPSEPTKTQELEKQINELRKELEEEEAKKLPSEKTISHLGSLDENECTASNPPSFRDDTMIALSVDSDYNLIADHLTYNGQVINEQYQTLVNSLKLKKNANSNLIAAIHALILIGPEGITFNGNGSEAQKEAYQKYVQAEQEYKTAMETLESELTKLGIASVESRKKQEDYGE